MVILYPLIVGLIYPRELGAEDARFRKVFHSTLDIGHSAFTTVRVQAPDTFIPLYLYTPSPSQLKSESLLGQAIVRLPIEPKEACCTMGDIGLFFPAGFKKIHFH